jgi:arylsulfatase A-like enzyme
MIMIMIMAPLPLWLSAVILLLAPFLFVSASQSQQPLGPLPFSNSAAAGQKQPNIIFILTDDQDLHMDSLSYMPHLKKHITDKGTTFQNHYCTVALCCPSRVSLWTGKAAHNTNVTDVNPPYGGYPKFISQGLNSAYLPIWLQELGYSTYYVGKLFNAQTVDNYASPPAAGWTGSEFLLDPYTYEYLNATFTRNGGKPQSYENQYTTDIIRDKAFAFLDDALSEQQTPFFLTIAPTAPHTNVHIPTNIIDGNFTEHSNTQLPPIPASRHAHLFPNITVPRTPHFNPPIPHSVSWISHLPLQNTTNLAYNDNFYRRRLQSLQSVDEIIEELVQKLEIAGILEETYIIYSTDNGYHIGQHRLQPGKQCAFEEDVNIPFIIRGPGIPGNYTSELVTSHTDIAPTILSLAGAEEGEMREDFDGLRIPVLGLKDAEKKAERNEHVNIEMWGIIMSEGKFGSVLFPNHTYKALRIVGRGYNFLYTVWCSGEHELYDLVVSFLFTSFFAKGFYECYFLVLGEAGLMGM